MPNDGPATSGNAPAEGARAILRVPEVLMAVAAVPGGSGFAQLQERLALPKASLHRLLLTLEKAGYVAREGGLYTLGPATGRLVKRLGGSIELQGLKDRAHPILEWLASSTGESVMLAEPDDERNQVYYADVINSAKQLRFTVPVGHTRPLYAAASGQVILAFLPDELREAYFARTEFQQLTEETITPAALRDRLGSIRREGFAFDKNSSFIGAGSIASACFDAAGNVTCAISVAGPSERLEADLNRLAELILEAGRRMCAILGYRGPFPVKVPGKLPGKLPVQAGKKL